MLVIKCTNSKPEETVPQCRKRMNCKEHCGECGLMKIISELK